MDKILAQTPTVAIITVTWNSAKEITECLAPLMDLPENWEIWVSDNDSKDNTVQLVKEKFPRAKVLENKENLGFAKGCNVAIEKTNADYVLLLNPDSIVTVKTLIGVLDEAQKAPKLGAMGIKILSEKGEQLTSCFAFPTLKVSAVESLGLYRLKNRKWLENNLFDNFFDHESVKKVDWVAGCFVLTPKRVLDKIGNVPDDYFMFGDDIDLCYKVWQSGHEVVFYPQFSVIHKGSKSVDQLPSNWRIERTMISRYAFSFKYYGWLKTRLSQICDYTGFLVGAWWVRIRKPDSALKDEWKMYRKVVAKSLKMNEKKILDLLNNRLD